MVIDRQDNAINICEMKFYNTEYILNADHAKIMRLRKTNFIETTKTKKQIITTLITTYGLVKNIQSPEIDNCLTINSLFE